MNKRFPVVSLIVVVMLTIFIGEGSLMLLLHAGESFLSEWSPRGIGMLNAFALTLLVTPALYVFLFRPLVKQMEECKRIEMDVRRLAAFPELNDSPVFEINSDLAVTYVNPAGRACFPDLSERRSEHPILKGISSLITELQAGSRPFVTREIRDGENWYEQQISAVPSAAVFHIYMKNITERRQTEQFKDDFIYILPHELRTPLTVLREGSELFATNALGSLSPQQKDFFKTMIRNIDRISALVSKIELAEQLMLERCEFTMRPMDLVRVLKETASSVSNLADAKHIKFHYKMPESSANYVGDAHRLAEAVRELIVNGIQVSPDGAAVTLSCTAIPDGWQIQVIDQGPGIPQEELSTLFDRFRSVGDLGERQTGGIGLGLYIAKRIIEIHGGELTVASESGKGSCMMATIKVKTGAVSNSGTLS